MLETSVGEFEDTERNCNKESVLRYDREFLLRFASEGRRKPRKTTQPYLQDTVDRFVLFPITYPGKCDLNRTRSA